MLLRTNVDKLTILPSGTPHPRATELLASDAMVKLLEDMATRYPDRIIIFDSPPLLLTTESRVLATHMGQIVMVVQRRQNAAGRCAAGAGDHRVVPGQDDAAEPGSSSLFKGGYGYGYGYEGGYGYGYGLEKAA